MRHATEPSREELPADQSREACRCRYTKLRFGFSSEDYGIYNGVSNAANGVALVLLLPLLLAAARNPLAGATLAIRIGTATIAVVLLAYACASARWQLWVILVPLSWAIVYVPASRAIASSLVSADEQGQGLGLLAIVEAFSATAVPLVWGYVYTGTVEWFPPFAFFCLSATGAICFCLSCRLAPPAAPDESLLGRAVVGQAENHNVA